MDAGYNWTNARLSLPGVPTAASVDPSGFTLGAHAGYRYQFNNNMVLGGEVRGFANFENRSTTGYAAWRTRPVSRTTGAVMPA